MSNIKSDNGQLKKLNIENLFSSKESIPHANGKIDINTLFSDNNDNFVFDSNMLLNNAKKRKIQLEETHSKIFNSCCRTIMLANESGITDIFFDVPDNILECIDYDPKICTKYIKEKLLEHEIKSLIIKKSKTKMFITWKNLEEKLDCEPI